MLKLISAQSKLFLLVLIIFSIPNISLSQDTTNFLSKFKSDDNFDWLQKKEAYYILNTASYTDSVTNKYNKGILLLENKEYQEAIEHFKCSYNIRNYNIDSWKNSDKDSYYPDILIGYCFNMLEEQDSALFYYHKSIIYNPDFEDPYMDIARLYGKNKEYDSCLHYCNNVLDKNPLSVDAMFIKAVVYFEKGKVRSSTKELQKALEVNPKNIHLNLLLGEIYYNKNKRYKALDVYNRVIKLDSTLAYAYTMRGICYFAINKYNNAIRNLKKAIKLDSLNSSNYFTIGLMYISSPYQTEIGIKNIAKSIVIDKTDTTKYYQYDIGDLEFREIVYELDTNTALTNIEKKAGNFLVEIYAGESHGDKAYRLYQIAQDYPNSIYINRIYNLLLYEFYKDRMNTKYAEKILYLDSTITTINVMLANQEYKKENYEKALKRLIYVTEVIPEFLQAHEIMADIYIKTDELSKTIKELETIENLKPGLSSTKFKYAEAYYKSGLYNQSLTTYLEINKEVNNYDTHNYIDFKIAECFEKLNKPDSALSYINIVCKNKQTAFWEAYALRGKLYVHFQDYDNANTDLSYAIYKTNTENAELYYYRSLTHKAKGHNREAIADLKSAIYVDNNYTEAFFELAKIYYEKGKYKDAIKYGNKAIDTKYYYFEAMYLVALSKLRSGNYEEAENDYKTYARENLCYNKTIDNVAITGLQSLIDNNIEKENAQKILDLLNQMINQK